MIFLVIDIIALLKAFNGKLENVRLFGKISARLNRPSNLSVTCKEQANGIFAKFEVYAIDLSYYSSYLKDYGYHEKDGIYLLAKNSSVCVYIPKEGYRYPDFYTVNGTLRFGSKSSNSNYCVMFNFRKYNNNWEIKHNSLSDVVVSDWEEGSEHKVLGLRMAQLGEVQYSKSADNLVPIRCVEDKRVYAVSDKEQGVSTSENYISQTVLNSNINKQSHESRNKILAHSEVAKKLQDKLNISLSSRYKFIARLKNDYSTEDADAINRLATALLQNFSRKASVYGSTGKSILTKYLKEFSDWNKNYLGTKLYKLVLDSYSEIYGMITNGSEVSLIDHAWTLCKNAFGDREVFYAGVVSKILGIPTDKMFNLEQICAENGIHLSKLLNDNPYYIIVISQDFKFNEVEYIAHCFGVSNNKDLDNYRNMGILDSFINDKSNGSTLFNKTVLYNNKLGLIFSQAKHNKIASVGTYLSNSTLKDIETFIGTKVSLYSSSGFRKQGYNFIKPLNNSEVIKAIELYIESGLGIDFENYITSSNYLNKELYVYNFLYDMGSTPTNFDVNLIEKYIKEYESIVGFTLEEEQHKAVLLLLNKAGVVAGSAGSGKTTVSNCLVYVLRKLVPDLSIKFAAPTGKAAKRMQEVVKEPVKTLCSMFRTANSDTSGIFDRVDEDDGVAENNVAYFFDESAMVTIDLLYSVLTKMSSDSYLYLFGDFHQLSPIGKGVPFKDALRFMPCVFLTVSKRAAEGSQITANSDIINNNSEYDNWKPLVSGKDFFLAPCNDDIINNLIVALCKFYLNKKLTSEENNLIYQYVGSLTELTPNFKYSKDDIQVVTPLAKSSYRWGSSSLNKILQPIFNETRSYDLTFYTKLSNSQYKNKFVVGDRVIHKDTNMYSMQWYSSYENGEFKKIWGSGIFNGEVGTIVGFYPTESCIFEEPDEEKPEGYVEPRNIRDDSKFNDTNTWFVVVKYYDYMSDKDFYILYRCKEDLNNEDNTGITFISEDLTMLDLFYAGTTHKFQGSQAKIVIAPLGVVNFKGFITRNMMYTVYTRAEKIVIALGSVGNDKNSMLSRARHEVAESSILTIGEIL